MRRTRTAKGGLKTDYDAADILVLVLHFTDKPVSREVSQDWNLNIAFADDGSKDRITPGRERHQHPSFSS